MLFSTAFYANARSVAQKSVGSVVKTLPFGTSQGMYHIRVDSICLPIGPTHNAVWVPTTYDPANPLNTYFQYDESMPDGTPLKDRYHMVTGPAANDTLVLSVTESGYVAMISASDLRNKLNTNNAQLTDLQSTMWCTNIQEPANLGQWPTFHFTNKIHGHDLDWAVANKTQLGGNDKGWMYSPSYDNEQLKEKLPFYRFEDETNGRYNVIAAELDGAGSPSGYLQTKSVDIASFVQDTVVGMIKFSIVKISPFVMTAKDFNTQLNNTDGKEKVKLSFNPEPQQVNYFGYKLVAEESAYTPANLLTYLNVRAYDDNDNFVGYIFNSNRTVANDADKYNNEYGGLFLNLRVNGANGSAGTNDVAANGNNFSYRFVYFPSEDSLVINAYHAAHDNNPAHHGSRTYTDNGFYDDDIAPIVDYYYGLYNTVIHDGLIVRYQDLNGVNGATSMMTVDKHPANTRIYLGLNNCTENFLDAWQVPEGVYTIWDVRGRVLGVRIYNGGYSPQWIELEEGECPDRIPSYQWVVKHSNASVNRIDLYSREFGNLAPENMSSLVAMMNVLVRRGEPRQIFREQGQFYYDPIATDYQDRWGYEPITYGYVKGSMIAAPGAQECVITSASGFRPVTNEYVTDQYLGYKHFNVDTDPTSVGYGKSEDIDGEWGMDYNAYAFNYLYYDNEKRYIHMKSNFSDTILNVPNIDDLKTGFQFMLGTQLRSHGYMEEMFGFPRTAWGKKVLTDSETGYSYTQNSVPVLKRYYYELKVADFYDYRDGLEEQFVVLKGAKEDGSDIKNMLKYGVADVWADKDPFKFANIYLRESFFLVRDAKLNEERHEADPTRRIFYALLDRIEAEQLERVTSVPGFEVSDTLMGADGTSKYNLVTIKVEDAYPAFLKAQGKTVSSGTGRVSTFALENINYPLYRRLRSTRDDGATPEGDGIDPTKTETALDAPKTLRIHRRANSNDYLHEDALSDAAYNYGINFLGSSNIVQNPEKIAPDGMVKYNYNLFIDTAFINRGTGWIKPQYLIAVGQEVVPSQVVTGYDNCGDPVTRTIKPYIIGRYLVNATDSARTIGSDGSDSAPIRDARYIYDTSWDRLAFVDAIHVDDRLYIVSQMNKLGLYPADYIIDGDDGKKYIDGDALYAATLKGGKLANAERTPRNSAMYGAFYDFGTWNNYHNDVCFSLRFKDPYVINPDENGDDVSSNDAKAFYIESETTNRTVPGNRKIAPVQGGWIKLQNWVPVLSRTSHKDGLKNGEVFNVELPTDWQDGNATSNESVTSKFSVATGNNEVVILNAAGKNVTITNLLGQTLVNKELKGDNEKISVAKGLVIVNVEGEKAVKAIVK